MSEQKRETLFWRLTVVVCLISPGVFPAFFKVDLTLPEDLTEWVPAFMVLLVITLLTPILIDLVAAALQGHPIRIGQKNLTTRIDETVYQSPERVRAEIEARLATLGFLTEAVEEPGTIVFSKMKPQEAHHFMDHNFVGRLTCSAAASGTRIQAELTFRELIVLDTGEANNLSKLCRQICGLEPAEESPNMPFIVPVGFSYALVTLVLGVVSNFNPVPSAWVLMTAAVGSLANTSGLLRVQANPARHFGRRIALASLYLSALPLLMGAARLAVKEL
jgi:hypothetical protein